MAHMERRDVFLAGVIIALIAAWAWLAQWLEAHAS